MKKHFVKSAQSLGTKGVAVRAITVALSVAMLGMTGCGKTAAPERETPARETSVAAESSVEESSTVSETSEEKVEESSEAVQETVTEESQESETAEDSEEAEETKAAEESEEDEKPEEDTAGMSDRVLENRTGNLLNGNFASGLDYYTLYAVDEYNMDYKVSKAQGLNVTISDTGTEDWHIQLKQEGIKLVQGNWYQLKLDAKSSVARTIGCAMQRDGSNDNNWALYSNASRLALGSNWETFTLIFQMNEKTDSNALFNLSLGTVDGAHLTKKHTVGIRNISLTKLADNWMDTLKQDGNMLGNADFAYGDTLWDAAVNGSAKGTVSLKNGQAVFDIQDPGELDWHVQMKQTGIALKQNCGYRLTFKVTSSEMRTMKVGFMDTNYVTWYGGGDLVVGPNAIIATTEFYNRSGANDNALMFISMGQIDGKTPASKIVISDIKLVEVPNMAPVTGGAPSAPVQGQPIPEGWSVNCAPGNGRVSYADGTFTFDIANPGVNEWDVQLKQTGFALEQGSKYHVTYTINSTEDRMVKTGYFSTNYAWYAGADLNLKKNEPQNVDMTFTMTSPTDENALLQFSLGQMYTDPTYTEAVETVPSIVTISDYKLEKIVEEPKEPSDALLTGTMNKKGDEIRFNYAQFADDSVEVGDIVTLVGSFKSNADSWGGGFGGADLVADGNWNQVMYSKDSDTVTLTLTADRLPGGGLNDYAQAQIWWPEAEENDNVNIEFSLLSVTVTKSGAPEEEKKPLAVIHATDEKDAYGNLSVAFNPYDLSSTYQTGDSIKITVTTTSDSYYGGVIGMCQEPNYSWTSTAQQDAGGNSDAVWVHTVENSMGDVQVQIYYMGGETITIKDIQIEPLQ